MLNLNIMLRYVLVLLSFLLVSCSNSTNKNEEIFSGAIMGTQYRIVMITELNKQQTKAIHQSILARLQALNLSLSTYEKNSDLNQLSYAAAGKSMTLKKDLKIVLDAAIKVNHLTEGAYDVTIAPIVDLWGFGPSGRKVKKPTHQQLQRHKFSVGMQNIQIKDNQFVKKNSNTQLDFSSIAKGYAVDVVSQILDKHDVHHYLVDIGGELKAKGKNRDNVWWRVGIENPNLNSGVKQILDLKNQSIATSGNYLNYIEIENERFSHTIDPRTLYPVKHKLVSATIIHSSAMMADALATAIMVMGEQDGLKFAEQNGLACYLIINDAQDSYRVKQSKEFRRLFP